MAYGYGFATGRPAACFLITGPGLANAATAIGEARSESIPMLVLATNIERSHLGLDCGRLHETKSQIGIAAQLCDMVHQLLDHRNLPSILGRAFSRFKAARPGPVYLEIPLDLLTEPSSFDTALWPAASLPSPDSVAIAQAARMLAKASVQRNLHRRLVHGRTAQSGRTARTDRPFRFAAPTVA
jgi:acetolactate synthase-1/2/3 large subunit